MTAAAIIAQHSAISRDQRTRTLTAVLALTRHWLREAEQMLPSGGTRLPEAEDYQTRLITAELSALGAKIHLGTAGTPNPDSHIALLDITVRSDRGGLELLRAWAAAAEVVLINMNQIKMAHTPERRGA